MSTTLQKKSKTFSFKSNISVVNKICKFLEKRTFTGLDFKMSSVNLLSKILRKGCFLASSLFVWGGGCGTWRVSAPGDWIPGLRRPVPNEGGGWRTAVSPLGGSLLAVPDLPSSSYNHLLGWLGGLLGSGPLPWLPDGNRPLPSRF